MSNSKIYIKLSNIGYQKPVDITISGISDIESVEITSVKDNSIIVDNNKVFDEENTDYISNTEDNCVYEFIEDIEVLRKGGEIVKYAKVIDDDVCEYVEYEELPENKYEKDEDGNVILYYKVVYERLDEINNEERYEKYANGMIIFYYKLKKNGEFKEALGPINVDEYENENGQAVSYVKIIKDWSYVVEFNENNKNIYEVSDTITSIGHVIINKLKLEADPTMFYRLVKFTRETNSSSIYETNEKGEKIEFAYNIYKKAYQVYKENNNDLYKKDKDKNVVKYYKEIKKENAYVIGSNITSDDGWELERGENGLLIKYAKNVKNNKYEIYDSKNKENYFKSDGEKIGIPFILRLSYKNDNNEIVKKSVYFAITIPYKTMGSNLELPLLYRPFYFNSVLLLTPQTLTPNYYYNIRDLHKVEKSNNSTAEKVFSSIIYTYETTEETKKRMNIQYGNGVSSETIFPTTGGDGIKNYNFIQQRPVFFEDMISGGGGGGDNGEDNITTTISYCYIELVNNDSNVWNSDVINNYFKSLCLALEVECSEDNTVDRISIINGFSRSVIIPNETVQTTWYGSKIETEKGETYPFLTDYKKTVEKGEKKLFEFILGQEKEEIKTSEKVYIVLMYEGNKNFKINVRYERIEKKENEVPSENCCARLFYSIANGCSIREDLGDANLYRLNNVTLSYINGSKAGDMVIHRPFRCFNEIEETEIENNPTIIGTKKITKEMMYGITEPFLSTTYEGGIEVTEKRYLTQKMGESYKYKELYIGYTFGRSEERTVTWEHNYLTGEDNGIVEEYKIYWKSKYGCVYRNGEWVPKTRYKNTIEIFKKNGSEWKKIAGGDKDYRRTDTTWYFDGENNTQWIVDYVLYATATGESKITVKCEYKRNYTIYKQINRCGLPCVEINDDKQKTLISYQSLEGNENKEICDRGIREVYCGLNSYSEKKCTFSEDTGSIIPVYDEDKSLDPIIFDTSKWLDVSFSVTEGHPEDDNDADTAFIGLNDVKFYDDILWNTVTEILYDKDGNEVKNDYEGVHVKGYSSQNVRYFVLGQFGGDDNPTSEDGVDTHDCGSEIKRLLESLYGIGVKYHNEYVRYGGVNINDYIYVPEDKPGQPHTKWMGWKSIHTFFGTNSIGTSVWLSSNSATGNWGCIDITDELTDLRKNPYQKKDNKFGCTKGRNFIIGLCDNYTCLDASSYEQEKKQMYSVIKPHTSRFAVIRLYKIEKS